MQDVPYADLRARLLADKAGVGRRHGARRLRRHRRRRHRGDVDGRLDDRRRDQAVRRDGYRHDANATKSKKARFVATLPKAGHYEVRLAYTINANRATNVPVAIEHAAGTANVVVTSKRRRPSTASSRSWAEYDFTTSAAVEISTAGTNGYVIIDAVQFVAK